MSQTEQLLSILSPGMRKALLALRARGGGGPLLPLKLTRQEATLLGQNRLVETPVAQRGLWIALTPLGLELAEALANDGSTTGVPVAAAPSTPSLPTEPEKALGGETP